jgi:hypothetical protein
VLYGVRAQLVGVGYIGNLQIIILAKSPRGPGERQEAQPPPSRTAP